MSRPVPYAKKVEQEEEKIQARSNSRITTQSTALIKLPS
jgi:hypothetical protein